MKQRETLTRLWVRALLYMLVVGGCWLVALPGLLALAEEGQLTVQLRSLPVAILGSAIFVAGLLLALASGYYLITYGHGTPLPLDPTQELVTQGPYAHVRNPQAMAMVLMVIGECVTLQSQFIWLLLPLSLLYLEGLAGPWEDRQLTRQYGRAYLHYRQSVRKWLPRARPYHAQIESPAQTQM
jgi:protein-S-isoprenylcysteine O-methyltransferase Ste14